MTDLRRSGSAYSLYSVPSHATSTSGRLTPGTPSARELEVPSRGGSSRMKTADSERSVLEAVAKAKSFHLGADPNILRAVRSRHALARFGSILRAKNEGFAQSKSKVSDGTLTEHQIMQMCGSWHPRSFKTETINDFWSHSWHARSSWQKVVVLLLHYNKWRAVLLGMCVGCIGTCLTGLNIFPPFVRNQGVETDGTTSAFYYSAWTLIFGTPSCIIGLVFWPDDTTVFLDKMCIHQTNPQKKKEGVLRIGSFLKASERMIVLWDPTYVTRLWCVFELAAYSTSHQHKEVSIVTVRPLIWGLSVTVVFFGSGFCCCVFVLLPIYTIGVTGVFVVVYIALACLSHLLRTYMDMITTLRDDFTQFSTSRASCFCCSVHHLDPITGRKLRCDRIFVESCIMDWFGSLDCFNSYVRSTLSWNFENYIFAGVGMPYSWSIAALMPCWFAFMDIAASKWRRGDHESGIAVAIYAFNFWLALMPIALNLLFAFAKCVRKTARNTFVDVALSLLAGLMGMIFLLGFFGITYATTVLFYGYGSPIILNVLALVLAVPCVMFSYSPWVRRFVLCQSRKRSIVAAISKTFSKQNDQVNVPAFFSPECPSRRPRFNDASETILEVDDNSGLELPSTVAVEPPVGFDSPARFPMCDDSPSSPARDRAQALGSLRLKMRARMPWAASASRAPSPTKGPSFPKRTSDPGEEFGVHDNSAPSQMIPSLKIARLSSVSSTPYSSFVEDAFPHSPDCTEVPLPRAFSFPPLRPLCATAEDFNARGDSLPFPPPRRPSEVLSPDGVVVASRRQVDLINGECFSKSALIEPLATKEGQSGKVVEADDVICAGSSNSFGIKVTAIEKYLSEKYSDAEILEVDTEEPPESSRLDFGAGKPVFTSESSWL